jgi:hypothetical protein
MKKKVIKDARNNFAIATEVAGVEKVNNNEVRVILKSGIHIVLHEDANLTVWSQIMTHFDV